MRLTEVQQPNTAEQPPVMSSRAFSAKSGQLEAGSTTTGSSRRPSTPPLAFCCSMSISITSLSVVSEIAIVPDSECRMPTLMGAPCAKDGRMPIVMAAAPPAAAPRTPRRVIVMSYVSTRLPRPQRAARAAFSNSCAMASTTIFQRVNGRNAIDASVYALARSALPLNQAAGLAIDANLGR